ncbi:DUF4402 domain-containing protein [uncultured Erythrobacter sp.]|uniref:DUF4402 domain-containing protein n=1 Tax=uncultured Erythrobacter sp. TaxID=263913 RepID=UPI0026250AF9|nr:DUF4402 domain-containing protein [uncultured Erythrobacter sp.]
MFRLFAFGFLRLGTGLGAALLALAGAPALLPVSPVWAQGNCPNCDLPPGCRGNNNNKNNGNGNGNGRLNCERLNITIESDIDFGRVVLLGDGEGRVVLDLATGKKTLIGDVDDLGGMPFTGRATITGAPFEQVMINLPSEVTMRDNQGGNALIRDFVSDLDTFAVLDGYGQLEFSFSGTLVLGAEQVAAGNLRGRVPISVEYP